MARNYLMVQVDNTKIITRLIDGDFINYKQIISNNFNTTVTINKAQFEDSLDRASILGRVFQDPMMGTNPNMMIEENMALAMRRGQRRGLKWGISQKEREFYHEQLKLLRLGLEDRLTTKVGLLSGGQRQALTLMMATLKKPKVLLLDEHTAALDPKTAEKVLEMSDRVVEENHLTTLMVTHNMKDAIAHGNRLIMMDAGRVVVDISGEDKKKLTVPDLMALFSKASGSTEANDKMLLG